MRYIKQFVGFILWLTVIGSQGMGQNYLLRYSVFDNGGGESSSASFVLRDAIGQSVTGGAKSSTYIEQAGFYSYSMGPVVSIEETELPNPIPKVFSLSQNWPNPTTRTTMIRYGIPKPGYVSIRVYDVTGRVVKSLVEGERKPGFYTINWDLKKDERNRPTQGVYFIELKAGDFRTTKKLILL